MTSATSAQPVSLTGTGHAVNGAVTTASALIATQPLFTYKTYAMTGKGFPPFHRLWSGYCPNTASGAPGESINFFVYSLGVKTLKDPDKPLTDGQNLIISIASGSAGAPLTSPCTQGMIRQQLYGGSFFSHMRNIYGSNGLPGIFKGTLVTAWRESFYSCGVFAFNDLAKKAITPIVSEPMLRDPAAGLMSGSFAGAASTPFDLCKTLMQQDRTNEYPTFRVTAKKVVEQGGVKGLFKGAGARSMTIGGLIATTTILKDRIPGFLPGVFHEKTIAAGESNEHFKI